MSIKLIQKETTYDVTYNNNEFVVTVLEDKISEGYTSYDVYDEEGMVVEGELEQAVIQYLEENI